MTANSLALAAHLKTFASVLALSSGAFASTAFAQGSAPPPDPVAQISNNTSAYPLSFFAGMGVQNAEDMVRRVPGAQAVLDANNNVQQSRGFGAAGAQVLLNGRRFPGKSNDILANLRRVPATNVERIELISGASSQISVQSQGMLVNVVLREGASIDGSGAYEANFRFNDNGWADGDGLINYTRSFGRLTMGGGVERNNLSPETESGTRWTSRTRAEVYYYPTGQLQELRPQEWERRHNKWTYTSNLNYEFAGGQAFTLNGQYTTRNVYQTDITPLTRYSTAGVQTLRATERHNQDALDFKQFEISGEFTARIGGGDFTGLFITQRYDASHFDSRDRDDGIRLVEVSSRASNTRNGEDIVRLSYVFPLDSRISLETGAEGARNTLKQSLEVGLDRNGDGILEPFIIPLAEPEVKELRGEVYATVKWQLAKKLSAEGTLNYERSQITTNYPLYPKRTLGYLKPRVDLRYQANPSTQFRAMIDKRVSQLDFGNFVPSYNAIDDRVEAGNPLLVPEINWIYELGFEKRLPKDGGRFELRGFYQTVTGEIDWVPIRDDRGVLVSAIGNIQSPGKQYGAEAKLSLRLGFIGLRSAQLNLRGLRQWSNIVDPFTGKERRLGTDRRYAYDIGFRHDMTRPRLSYGATYRSVGDENIISNLLVSERYTIGPFLETFIERPLWGTMVLRFEANGLNRSRERRWRENYVVNAIDGRVRRIDFYEERRDMRFAVRLRGRF